MVNVCLLLLISKMHELDYYINYQGDLLLNLSISLAIKSQILDLFF